ncbi:LOW QUALITY PROTEIN: hypothetical protein HID58_031392, partial [Brassica napus]
TITEEPSASIFLDAGEAPCRRRRVLCSVQCSSPSSACSLSCSALLRLRSFHFSVLTTRPVVWGSSHFAIMPVSFNHLRISRSMSRRHGLPPAPPSLPHQVGRDTFSPCVAGTPPCCRVSVPIAHFLLKTSSPGPISPDPARQTHVLTVLFSGIPRRPDVPLFHCVLLKNPFTPEVPPHHALKCTVFPLAAADPSPACVSSHFRHTHSSGCLGWACTTKSTIFASPQTSHPNLKPTRSVWGQKMQPPRLLCVILKGWPSTSHYVTKFQLSDFVGNALSTHSSFVLNSQSSFFEDLYFLIWFVIVVYAFDLRGWIIPSYVCIEES